MDTTLKFIKIVGDDEANLETLNLSFTFPTVFPETYMECFMRFMLASGFSEHVIMKDLARYVETTQRADDAIKKISFTGG